MGFGFMGFGYWFMILPILAVVVIIVILVLESQSKTRDVVVSRSDRPYEIIKRRYASGEISKEEFDQLKKDLGE